MRGTVPPGLPDSHRDPEAFLRSSVKSKASPVPMMD
jgi:hypothetical protein